MKFTQEQLAEELKAKMGKDLAMSERTLNAQAARLYARLDKAGNEEEIDAVVADYLPDFEEINANVRNEHSRFVKDWMKKHPEKETEQTDKTSNISNNAKQQEDKLDILMREIQELKEERMQAKAEAAAKAKKEEIRQSLKQQGINNDKWIEAYMRKQSYGADTDTQEEVKDIIEFYNLNNAGGGNANVGRGGGRGKEEEVDFSDIVAIRKRQRGLTA